MPRTIAAVISSGKATLRELQSDYGLEDVYDLLEVVSIDAFNRQLAAKKK